MCARVYIFVDVGVRERKRGTTEYKLKPWPPVAEGKEAAEKGCVRGKNILSLV